MIERPRWSFSEAQPIIAETLQPGASVSPVAHWRGRLRMLAKRQMTERRRHGGRADPVELLYSEIMRSTATTLR